MANPENPFLETTPTAVGITPSVFEAITVSAEVVSSGIDLHVSVSPAVEAVSNVLIPVESVCNVSKSFDVIVDPPQSGNE